MGFKTTDFYGNLHLNKNLLEELEIFLKRRETLLADQLLAVFPLVPQADSPVLAISHPTPLAEAIETIANRALEGDQELLSESSWHVTLTRTNQIFWEAVELIEGSASELFQRLHQIGVDKWTGDFFHVVEDIKNLLETHIQDLLFGLNSLEKIFQKSKFSTKNSFWSYFGWSTPVLDRKLKNNLQTTKKYLNTHFEHFKKRFDGYTEQARKVESLATKFYGFIGFRQTDEDFQEKFLTLYRLVKLWESNLYKGILSREEIFKAMKHYTPPGKALRIFREYFLLLKRNLFEKSREWKFLYDTELYDQVAHLKIELVTLGATVGQFREMVLKTNPNPYIRTRLGFSEWIVGPEPRKTKEFIDLIYEIEKIKSFYEHLEEAISLGPPTQEAFKRQKLIREIENILHEMGQPLASRSLIHNRSGQLIDLLEACDELGGTVGSVRSFMGTFLVKALHYDWKYQVLPENPKFEDLVTIHLGFKENTGDFFHEQRLYKFSNILHRVEHWIKNNDAFKHIQEIETDISDIKESLQDYLRTIKKELENVAQGLKRRELVRDEILYQLLEYRYLFARFFFFLKGYEEGQLIRSQFLFADQYFEAVESFVASLEPA